MLVCVPETGKNDQKRRSNFPHNGLMCSVRPVHSLQAVLQGVHQPVVDRLLFLPRCISTNPFTKVGCHQYLLVLYSSFKRFFSPVIGKLVPSDIPNIPFHIMFKQGEGDTAHYLIDYRFSTYDGVSLAACSLVGAWYLLQKHWIANNLFGLAFAVNAVELLHLNNVVTGCILLCGLFFYDIFWVFGTDVMVTVAKSFEAPIKRKSAAEKLTNSITRP